MYKNIPIRAGKLGLQNKRKLNLIKDPRIRKCIGKFAYQDVRTQELLAVGTKYVSRYRDLTNITMRLINGEPGGQSFDRDFNTEEMQRLILDKVLKVKVDYNFYEWTLVHGDKVLEVLEKSPDIQWPIS